MSLNPADVKRQVAALRDELLDLAQELVRIPSITGDEAAAQEHLAGRMRDWGWGVDLWTPERDALTAHPAFCDDGNPVERPVLVGTYGEPADEPAALILNGHIDVVPTGMRGDWDDEPFGGDVRGGQLHGRGSCDMKGGLAAACMAVRVVESLGVTPRRRVLLQSVTGEETGGVGTLATILRGHRADAAVIAEPTRLCSCPVQAGALSFRVRIPGRASHGATRELGVSAVDKLVVILEALRYLERARHDGFHHPMYDPARLAAPLSVGTVSAGDWPSTVPDQAVAEGRYGVFPGEDCAEARERFEFAVHAACQNDDWLREHPAVVEWFEGQFEPGETASDAPVLARLAECHRDMSGRDVTMHGVTYGSDLRLFTRYASTPAVLYGPGDVQRAHSANELVPVDELLQATEVFALLVARSVE